MNIVGISPTDFTVVANDEKYVLLSYKELEEYLHYYPNRTQKLTYGPFWDSTEEKVKVGTQVELTYFKHLIKLKLHHVRISSSYFESLALANLEHLEIVTIFQVEFESILLLKNLKSFRCWEDPEYFVTYETMWKFLTHPKLETLRLEYAIASGEVKLTDTYAGGASQLKELEIPTLFDSPQWLQHFFLENIFENLVCLRISNESLHNDVLNKIAATCKNLRKLTFESTVFIEIQSFALPKSLLELSLTLCKGLTRSNFKEILTESTITKFCTSSTDYSGEFEDFEISKLIVTLHDEEDNFITDYTNPNLKELSCCYFPTSQQHIEKLSLEIPTPMEPILLMKHLQHLDIYWNCINLSNILVLLKHPSLKHLRLGANRITDAILPEGFKTNINHIEIRGFDKEDSFDFWLALLSNNVTSMVLTLSLFQHIALTEKIVSHEQFPKELKTINIYGLRVECDTLRNNFIGIMAILKNYCSYSEIYTISLGKNA